MNTTNLIKKKPILFFSLLLSMLLYNTQAFSNNTVSIEDLILPLVKQHPDKTGLYNLEKGGEALLARAWLANRATKTIDVQYFIWANDNIGKLAAEILLRAADRGVKVRVLVDDLLIDAESKYLFALAVHPNINIRIYNPVISVGVNLFERIFSAVTDFRGSNQRMHNKMFIVDSAVAITGGRNMENPYFDFGQKFNYRDRDVLLIGNIISEMNTTFTDFWNSKLAKPVEKLVKNPFESEINWAPEDEWGDELIINEKELQQQLSELTEKKVASIYQYLHDYANNNNNFLPEVRNALIDINHHLNAITQSAHWLDATFISDIPGKNTNNAWFNYNLGGGGNSATALAKLIDFAKNNIIIQTPYLVLSPEAWRLLKAARARGVSIKINTNSLAASDNLPAFSGYSAQIEDMLAAGIEIYEYRPDAKRRQQLVKQYDQYKGKDMPTFSIHAKTMVIDDSIVFIGSYNFDPRSQNLNTEIGVITKHETLAKNVKREIEIDMQEGNSWNVKVDGQNNNTSFAKQSKLFFWKLLPIDAIL
ncbi:Cardiolipin synthetase [hydrothermal vent metagenome]|uniref:Cardiolipin synthetase n=1 Tax=hydrothermal vent metagenome TaxID=652676 RepID=A0A3B0WZ79_9ZZZZ